MRAFSMFTAAVLVSGSIATAGEVKLSETHLCCGACVKAVEAALTDVDGVSDVKVDKDAKTVTFTSTDAKTARGGIVALAKAGYGGKATHAGKEMKLPKGFKEDGSADTVTVRGLHNCCAGCAKSITAALTKVEGVSDVKCKEKACTITGTNVSYAKVIAALHEAGLHGNIPAKKAE